MSSMLRAGAAGALLCVLSFSQAFAEPEKFIGELKGAAEVPPVETTAAGKLSASFEPTTKSLTWEVEYMGLSGPATGAHFHGPAAIGEAAGVALPMAGDLSSPIKGTATLTDAQIKDLQAERWYVNIHTAKNPKGEIRGQVTKMKPAAKP